MKILILGAAGMFGHRLWLDLPPYGDVWATLRGRVADFPLKHIAPERLIEGVNANQLETVRGALGYVKPDVVINCIGVIKQRDDAKQAISSIELNALFPHRLAALCGEIGCRLIHISTDCVFTGEKGNYTESDPTDAHDIYGKTKALGELSDLANCLTLRTSIIGRELATRYGLVEWFLSQTRSVRGFQKAIYSGFPTTVLAHIIGGVILPRADLEGVYHVSSDPINKYDLLGLVKDAYRHNIEIIPDTSVVIDRSLNSDRFRAATGFVPASWAQMIEIMASEKQ